MCSFYDSAALLAKASNKCLFKVGILIEGSIWLAADLVDLSALLTTQLNLAADFCYLLSSPLGQLSYMPK